MTKCTTSLLLAVPVVVCTTPKVVPTVFTMPIVTTPMPALPILMASYTPSVTMPSSGTRISNKRCLDGYGTSMSFMNAWSPVPPPSQCQDPSSQRDKRVITSFVPMWTFPLSKHKTYVEFKPITQGGRNLLKIKKRNWGVSNFNSWEQSQPNSADYRDNNQHASHKPAVILILHIVTSFLRHYNTLCLITN